MSDFAEWFAGVTHPLARTDSIEQFEKIQWGREPDKIFDTYAPNVPGGQDVIQLGRLRAIWLANGQVMQFGRPYPFITVGERDHRLYFVGGSTGEMARRHEWGPPGSRRACVRIDYESRKGRKRGVTYYYHDHDAGHSYLVVRRDGWPLYEGPYDVRPEGIVG